MLAASATPNPNLDMPHPVFAAIARAGLAPRGALRLEDAERCGALAEAATIVLIGFVGREGWSAFAASPEARDGLADRLDRGSRRVIDGLAHEFGGIALYPFAGPPYWPFQQWALRCDAVHASPLGLLIHDDYGLWHSYRGALALPIEIAPASPRRRAHPCESCEARPCLSACPVGAFAPAAYDVEACVAHLKRAAGEPCMSGGCLARRACPVGAEHAHGAEQARFTMRAFLRARSQRTEA